MQVIKKCESTSNFLFPKVGRVDEDEVRFVMDCVVLGFLFLKSSAALQHMYGEDSNNVARFQRDDRISTKILTVFG
ncbi:hypothetical protein AKJ16_DCAP15430 [Drosera capensis]